MQIQRRIEDKIDVNAWRSLFLVNELNELQSYKIISTNMTLFFYALFIQTVGLRYWTVHDPELRRTRNNADESWVIFFFVSTLVMYVIAAVLYIGRYQLGDGFHLRQRSSPIFAP